MRTPCNRRIIGHQDAFSPVANTSPRRDSQRRTAEKLNCRVKKCRPACISRPRRSRQEPRLPWGGTAGILSDGVVAPRAVFDRDLHAPRARLLLDADAAGVGGRLEPRPRHRRAWCWRRRSLRRTSRGGRRRSRRRRAFFRAKRCWRSASRLVAVTHLLDVWLIWAPLYWLDALVRCVAALARLRRPSAWSTIWNVAIAEYGTLDALGLAELVRRRQVSAVELLEEAIARNERVNPKLGAVITTLYDDARRVAGAASRAGLADRRRFAGRAVSGQGHLLRHGGRAGDEQQPLPRRTTSRRATRQSSSAFVRPAWSSSAAPTRPSSASCRSPSPSSTDRPGTPGIRRSRRAARAEERPLPSPPGSSRSPTPTTAAARSASPPPAAASSA